jgi:hypothetical protein
LELLQTGHLSPFDLVLKVPDECNAQNSPYRAEFYKKDSQKFFKILDAISINGLGKQKLRSWMQQQSQGLGIFCDIINDEMDTVKGLEKLSGLAAITPEFIKSWSVSGCKELAPPHRVPPTFCSRRRRRRD